MKCNENFKEHEDDPVNIEIFEGDKKLYEYKDNRLSVERPYADYSTTEKTEEEQ